MSEQKSWRVDEDGDVLVILGYRKNHTHRGEKNTWEMARIDNAIWWDNPEIEALGRANANLLAASPDLLRFARTMEVELMQPLADLKAARKRMLKMAREVISQAEGVSVNPTGPSLMEALRGSLEETHE